MQSSKSRDERTAQRGGMAKATLKVVVVLLTIVVIDVALSFALEPYSSHSDVVWQDYRSRSDEPIDTVFLGSSSTEMGLNPAIIDDVAGTYSFNLATPAAGINNCRDTLTDVIGEHDIKRVVVGINYATMTSKHEINATIAITQAKMQGASVSQRLRYAGEALADKQTMLGIKSLDLLFPWSVLHVDYDWDLIKANVVRRQTMNAVDAAYPSPWVYVGRGFSGVDEPSPGFNNASDNVLATENTLEFSDENIEDLRDICRICRENGISLIVCVPPRPAYRTLMYGDDYWQNMSSIQQMVESEGGSYVDFNLAKPSFYDTSEGEFRDEYHLTLDGANRFSTVAAGIFSELWSGADVSSDFYTYEDWDAYLQSLDVNDFSPAFFSYEVGDGAIDVHPWSLTGPNVVTEYQVEVKNVGEADFTVLKDWSTDADCTYVTTGHGECTIRVVSRPVGVGDAVEHLCDKTVVY